MEKTECLEEKVDNKLAAGETDDVNSEVVPSIDSDKNSSSDLNFAPSRFQKFRENVNKRKRPRRKSKKGKYPYSKSSWQQRREQGNSERALRVRQQMFAHGQPVAPYNTTQFLIEDHGDLQNIDAQLQGSSTNRPSRARDSSFSIDSDEDYFYSSPEDEEEFLTKEFSNAYEDLHVERLNCMSKSEIIHDYLQLEAKYEKSLMELKRLRRGIGDEEEPGDNIRENEGDHEREGEERDPDTDTSSKSENEIAEQLRISQLENKSLKVELEELRKENKTLRSLVEKNQSSSVDSESDSSSSTSSMSDSSSSDSDSDEEMKSADIRTADLNESVKDSKFMDLNGTTENGYMSDNECEVEVQKNENEK